MQLIDNENALLVSARGQAFAIIVRNAKGKILTPKSNLLPGDLDAIISKANSVYQKILGAQWSENPESLKVSVHYSLDQKKSVVHLAKDMTAYQAITKNVLTDMPKDLNEKSDQEVTKSLSDITNLVVSRLSLSDTPEIDSLLQRPKSSSNASPRPSLSRSAPLELKQNEPSLPPNVSPSPRVSVSTTEVSDSESMEEPPPFFTSPANRKVEYFSLQDPESSRRSSVDILSLSEEPSSRDRALAVTSAPPASRVSLSVSSNVPYETVIMPVAVEQPRSIPPGRTLGFSLPLSSKTGSSSKFPIHNQALKALDEASRTFGHKPKCVEQYSYSQLIGLDGGMLPHHKAEFLTVWEEFLNEKILRKQNLLDKNPEVEQLEKFMNYLGQACSESYQKFLENNPAYVAQNLPNNALTKENYYEKFYYPSIEGRIQEYLRKE